MSKLGRRALVVGIDKYLNVSSLGGCENDACEVATLLESHQDGTPNYDVKVAVASSVIDTTISRPELRGMLQSLFSEDYRGDVFFYYSGHGSLSSVGGYIATSDAVKNDLGIPMSEVLHLASKSGAREVVLVLDCCHSGDLGNIPLLSVAGNSSPLTAIRENMSIMAASKSTQVAVEAAGHGLFTSALIDALAGGAADHMGWVTPPAVYAYIERRFGEFQQRPVYRSSATQIGVIRECAPLIERLKLYELVKLFPSENHKYQLDPEFEPHDEHGNLHEPVNEEKMRVASLLKDFRDAGLLRPSAAGEQLFWTSRMATRWN
jgi:hypothetical protein